ncbi:phage terminase small subunit [Vibrio algicola]|uniref:Terminase n=1 Tax=Vibrio algicola TaxID=2662262 RepID=A0A5Q0TFR2_9VIBR|nr:phage terminase small subunit [Vibrio algicola]
MRLSPGMRDNLAKRHQVSIATADQQTAVPQASADSLHLKIVELDQDRAELRARFTRVADRVEHKRMVLIPKYAPLAEQFLASGKSYDNPVFSTVLVWLFDVGELEKAIDWCLKSIELDVPTPDYIKRGWPTFCADQVLEWAEANAKHGNSVEPYFSQVADKVTTTWKIHEQIVAKFYKFKGLQLLRNEDGDIAITSVGSVETLNKAKAILKQAEDVYAKAGVASNIKKIDARIRALETGKNL